MRFQTAPTGPGEDMELPIYFLKLHQTAPDTPRKPSEAAFAKHGFRQTRNQRPGCDKPGSVRIGVNFRNNNRRDPQAGRCGLQPHRILRETLQRQRLLNTVSAKQETNDPVGISPVRLGNRTYRAWRIPKLTPMVRFGTAPELQQRTHD